MHAGWKPTVSAPGYLQQSASLKYDLSCLIADPDAASFHQQQLLPSVDVTQPAAFPVDALVEVSTLDIAQVTALKVLTHPDLTHSDIKHSRTAALTSKLRRHYNVPKLLSVPGIDVGFPQPPCITLLAEF